MMIDNDERSKCIMKIFKSKLEYAPPSQAPFSTVRAEWTLLKAEPVTLGFRRECKMGYPKRNQN